MVSRRLCAFVALIACLMALSRAQQPVLSYCSPNLNVGANQPASSGFQSTGLCSDHCRGSFAFAVLQGEQCWCSNYIPEDQVDTSECSAGCPGIDSEWCGNPAEGLYGYYAIPLGSPLGTSGDSGSSTPRTSSSSTSTTDGSRTTAPPTVNTIITTVTGQVSTVLVTQPATTDDAVLGQSSSGDGSGVSRGTIAGIVIAVVGGLAAVIGASLWFFCRRRRQNLGRSRTSSFTAERVGGSSSGQQSNSLPSRQVSQMSQAGLLGSKAPRLQTSGFGGGLGFDPRSPDPASAVDRRSVGTDQRLNPYAIYKQEDQMSSVSLHDERDYSRQLRVANPDE